VRTSSSWVNYFMWKCERHIPTSKVYPEIIAKCPACGFARPDAAYRPPMFPEEEKPVVRIVPPPPRVEVKPPPPAKAFSEDMSLGQAQRDLDESIIADLVAAAEKIEKSRVKAPTPTAPEPVVVSKRPKDIPVTAKSKKVHCPGPKCRKQARSTSPYCSKICSDRCLRLRKKFATAILTEVEVKNLNVILAALKQWEE